MLCFERAYVWLVVVVLFVCCADSFKRFRVVCEYEWSVVVRVLLLPFCVVLYCFVSRLHSFVRCSVVRECELVVVVLL